jgi:dTDP-4-amino-4,6-dideoxygalactose transaminase
MIPQNSPLANYLNHRSAVDAAICRVLKRGQYILGEETAAFEREFADYIGVKYAAGTGNGTEALHLALRALGVGPGDEVITVSHTAVATVAAIEMCGALPVLVDIHPASYTIDPELAC